MRLFLAIYPSQTEREKLLVCQKALKKSGCDGRETFLSNLHMTLAFLGEVAEDDVEKAKKALHKIRCHGFVMKMDQTAFFKNGENFLYYLAPRDDARVRDLAQMVRQSLIYQKIAFDQKPFVPHITLVREGKEVSPMPKNISIPLRVGEVHLMSSERANGELCYRVVDTQRLERG